MPKLTIKPHLQHRRRRRATYRPEAGEAPGVLAASLNASETEIRGIRFTPDRCDEFDLRANGSLPEIGGDTLWLDICGLSDLDAIERVCNHLGLHPLVTADLVHTHQRPKTDVHEDYVAVFLRSPRGGPPFESEQIGYVIGDGFVLTVQEHPGDCFEPVRDRVRQGGKRIRGAGPAYLAYALIDSQIDAYFPVLERYGDLTETLEERVIEAPDASLVAEIHLLKRELLDIRRALWPQREAINALLRDDVPHITDDVRTYLRDCADHSFQLMDMVEVYREVAQGLVDLHLSSVSNRMNEVMKVLTMIATIFIPMTFIAGLYGMNFDRASPWNLPELGWTYGYLYALALMATSAGIMVYIFTRKGWIGFRRKKSSPPRSEHKDQTDR